MVDTKLMQKKSCNPFKGCRILDGAPRLRSPHWDRGSDLAGVVQAFNTALVFEPVFQV